MPAEHTQGKWTVKEVIIPIGKEPVYKNRSIYDKNHNWVATVIDEANAKRICQMHNSFNGLLEVCKDILKYEEQNSGTPFRVERLKQAIAQAEEE